MQNRLPQLLASSVVRGTELGESHGGLYLVDLERGVCELKLDWNHTGIDIAGRGGDRGLRGIAFHGEHVWVAANAQLLMLDQDFAVIESFTNPYLRHCHEISVVNGRLYVTATGVDSVLVFDIARRRFVYGWHLAHNGTTLSLSRFDPTTTVGPAPAHQFHINSVSVSPKGMWFSGLHTPGLLFTDGRHLSMAAPLPQGTHNAQPLDGGIIYNDTAADRVSYRGNGPDVDLAVPQFDPADIINLQRFASEVARPGFARGLCMLPGGLVAAGSSPSTIAVYDLANRQRVLQQNLSMDVRNAVHGLAVWPYS